MGETLISAAKARLSCDCSARYFALMEARGGGEFVARHAEWRTLHEAFVQAARGAPRIVLLGADAGIGKTRLLTEFGRSVDGRVLWGTCPPMGDRGMPVAALVEVVRTLRADPVQRDRIPEPLARLLSQGVDDSAITRLQLFEGVLAMLEDFAGDHPVVLVLEDLHWSDALTRDLLAFLAPNLRAQRVLVIGSYRTEDVAPDSPLRRVLAELGRLPHVIRLELPPLDSGQIAERIRQLTGSPPSQLVVDRVLARTQGNAYFVEELVASGRLDRGEIPSSLRDLLLLRASVLSPAARRTLGVASLAVADIDEGLLAAVTGTSVTDIRAHLREAIGRHLLVATADGARFRHALLQEALRDELLPSERREHHADYAATLEADAARRKATPGFSAELAYHLQEAGDVVQAMRAWADAAAASEALSAFDDAHHHLTRVLEAWHQVPDAASLVGATEVDTMRRAAAAAFHAGQPEVAVTLIRRVIDLSDPVTDPARVGAAYERLSRYLRDTEGGEAADAAIVEALRLVPSNPPSAERAHVLAGQARLLVMAGQLRQALAPCQEAVTAAREVGDPETECDALNTLGILQCYLEDDVEGLDTIESALVLSRQIGDAYQQWRALWNRYVCAAESGHLEEAVERARVALVEVPRIGYGHQLPELYWHLQTELTDLGRFEEARGALDEAKRRFGADAEEAISLDLQLALGEFDEVRQRIAGAARDAVGRDDEGWIEWKRQLAELEMWTGNYAGAREALDVTLVRAAASDRPISASQAARAALRCEADVATIARREGRLADVAEAESRAEPYLNLMGELMSRQGPGTGWKRVVAATASLCAAEACRLRGEAHVEMWEQAVRRLREMKMEHLATYAELRLAEAVVSERTDLARASLLLTGLYARTSGWGTRPLHQLVVALAARAGVSTGCEPDAGDVSPHGLTPRERHVLALVARGASNRQIAEELFISEKTASVHVSNIIRKLGVGNRAEAAALAHREGLATDPVVI